MSWADDHLKDDFTIHSYTTGKDGNVTSTRHVRAGRPEEDVVKVPDPRIIARTSTLFGTDGEVRAQWVIEKPEDAQRLAQWRAVVEELTAKIPVRPLIPMPEQIATDDLLIAYPIGDEHLGMLAWKYEVGESNDIDIAEATLTQAMTYLVNAAPTALRAIIPVLGDFTHYDSFDSVTPTNRNLLDSDGRAPKMISAAIRLLENVVELAAQKHHGVHVILELGNHDPYTSMVLARLLQRIYQDNPRITVDINPSHFHYYEFGKILIGTHHGHGKAAKPAQLPGIMAADRREAWGRTEHHYWYTGHIHVQTVYEFPSCSVESFRIMPPGDAYLFNEGYRAKRDMKALILHREHGEVGRLLVNPAMLRRT